MDKMLHGQNNILSSLKLGIVSAKVAVWKFEIQRGVGFPFWREFDPIF